jgi:hypothetical protein
MDTDTDGLKDCCKKLIYFESKCVTQQQEIDTLTKEVSYLQERYEAQQNMLQDAFHYIKDLELKFNQFTSGE